MVRILAIIGAAFIGLIAGNLIGVFVACKLLWPESNLCGILGFVTGPVGFIAGGIYGWYLTRPKPPVA
jgi:hypothetical protein